MILNIITWLLFGLVAGIVANMIDPGESRGGAGGAIVLGILGALVGGFVANLLFGMNVSGWNLPSFAIAVLGSLLLLMLQKAFRRA